MVIRNAIRAALAAILGVACSSSPASPPVVTDCGSAATQCGSRCVNTQSDPANCGDCGVGCEPTEVCTKGTCAVACFGGATACGSSCVDVRYDPANCGFCGNSCKFGIGCLEGHCANGCGSKEAVCGAACKNTSTDNDNCGVCGLSCGLGAVCTSGICECKGAVCDGVCTELNADPLHCGSCSVACAGTSEVCSAGQCACAKGWSKCNGTCVDTTNSPKNCGACGTVCGAGLLCDAGACVLPTSEWPTQGADVFRDGVVSGELGKPPLAKAWSVTLEKGNYVQPVAVGKNRVFVTLRGSFSSSELRALDLSDGSLAWSYSLGPIFSAGYPTYSDGRVYIANGKGINGPQPRLLAFDATSGALVWLAGFDAQWEHYWSPLVVGGSLYTNAGTYGGLAAYDLDQGALNFFTPALEQTDQWSATWSGSRALTFVGGRLRAHSTLTGAIDWSTLVVASSSSTGTYPVVGGGRAFVIAASNLFAVDLATHAVAWTGYGAYAGLPALMGDSVCAFSSGNLIVRSASTGKLQWSFAGDGALTGTPVIANGVVYVSSATNTYAVDLQTHQQAWTTPVGGTLAVASRRLLIAADDTLYAYRMTN
ncbi:hypothetical protein BH09MYX1_BH09MYX1_54810 [soil metagenome]